MQPKMGSKIKLAVVALIALLLAALAVVGLRVGKYVVHPVAAELAQRGAPGAAVSAEYAPADAAQADRALAVLRARLRAAGHEDATVARLGDGRLRAEIPGGSADALQALAVAGHVEFRDPDGNVVLDGSAFVSAEPVYSAEVGGYMLNFALDKEGTAAFAKATQRLIDSSIAVYLDGEEISAPTVGGVIADGVGQIPLSSATTVAESRALAEKLSMAIMGGELPAALTMGEVQHLSRPIGIAGSANAALALGIGLLLAFAYLIATYRGAGVAASLGILISALGALYLMYELGNTALGIWGVAGLYLALAVALIAQVAVIERVRAEMPGRSDAVKAGFKAALPAVFDAHVAVGIVAAVLLARGGQLEIFARALMIGLCASLAAMLIFTKFLLRATGVNLPARRAIGKKAPPRKALIALAAMVAVGLVLQFAVGSLGMDFTGGALSKEMVPGGRVAEVSEGGFLSLSANGGGEPISGAFRAGFGDVALPLLLGFLCALAYFALRFGIAAAISALAALTFDKLFATAAALIFGVVMKVEASIIAALIAVVCTSLAAMAAHFDKAREDEALVAALGAPLLLLALLADRAFGIALIAGVASMLCISTPLAEYIHARLSPRFTKRAKKAN